LASEALCEEAVEALEDDAEDLKVQLLQLNSPLQLQRAPFFSDRPSNHALDGEISALSSMKADSSRDLVPLHEQYSLTLAKAFASLSQAAFCGAEESLQHWTCAACQAAGFGLAPTTQRLIRLAELGEQDSTFVFASRLQWLGSLPKKDQAWPSAKLKEPVANAGQDCWNLCGKTGGYCAWCGVGNACCRRSFQGDPAECAAAEHFTTLHHECVALNGRPAAVPVPSLRSGEDCWLICGKAGGYCDWCGSGNACCRQGSTSDPAECRGVTNFTSKSHHECVAASPAVLPPTPEDFGCVLAIRGSKTFTNALHDVFFWSDAFPYEACHGCQVYDGFWRVWTGVQSKVERVLLDSGCIPGTPQGTILLTGHSLGAAVATIAMYTLQARGYSVGLSYNFESPRVGNDAFATSFVDFFGRKVPLYRVTRARDPTVHVPPFPIYRHVGAEVYFASKGNASDNVVCYTSEESRCAGRYTLFETVFYGGDHCPSELVVPGQGEGEGLCQCAA